MRILYKPNEYSQQRQKDAKAKIYPVLMAMEATYYKNQGHDVVWDPDYRERNNICQTDTTHNFDKVIIEPEGLPFLELPSPDRILTRYWEYQDNGNFKYLPATYIQSARDCWYHKCTFCSWAKKYPKCETREYWNVIDEVKQCIDLGIKEIFDDSGTFPVEAWLRSFCISMMAYGYNEKIRISCNMRFGALTDIDFYCLNRAGFRMILWGLESINQSTLDKLNKGVKVEQIDIDLKLARNHNLWNHVAVMFGYPWETYEDSKRTYEYVKEGLLTNKIQSVQASIYDVPEVDNIPNYARKFRNKIYRLYYHPLYIKHRIAEIRSWDDIKYYFRGIGKLLNKLKRDK